MSAGSVCTACSVIGDVARFALRTIQPTRPTPTTARMSSAARAAAAIASKLGDLLFCAYINQFLHSTDPKDQMNCNLYEFLLVSVLPLDDITRLASYPGVLTE
jgi:hypothetical protein